MDTDKYEKLDFVKTRFTVNQTVKIRDGFYKGYKGKVLQHSIEKNEHYYLVDINNMGEFWINEKNLDKTILFGLI